MVSDLDAIHLRSHAESVCRDHDEHVVYGVDWSHVKEWDNYTYSLDILCLMALTEALGLEYGDYMKNLGG